MTVRKKIAYGDHPAQYGHLYIPDVPSPSAPLVVLVHGGYWSTEFGLTVQTAVARDIVARGAYVWNVEYRRVAPDGSSDGGGGWPTTRDDVTQAIGALDGVVAQSVGSDVLNVSNTQVVGHSAGGQLALCAVARLPTSRVRVSTVIAQAAGLDVVAAGEAGRESVTTFLGGTYQQMPDRYREASPAHLPVLDLHVVAIHGSADSEVPVEMSRRYVDQVTARGQSAELVIVPDGQHEDFIDPLSDAHRQTLRRLGI